MSMGAGLVEGLCIVLSPLSFNLSPYYAWATYPATGTK